MLNFIKFRISLFLIFHLLLFKLNAQVTDDVYYSNPNPNVKDTSSNSVAKIGHYISLGLGIGGGASLDLIGSTLSYSLAIKSHLISISNLSCSSSFSGVSSNDYYYSNKYFAIMFGEAFREKHILLSLSAGIGFSQLNYMMPVHNKPHEEYNENGYSIPIQIRFYFLAYNGIGIGLNFNKNFTNKYSSSLTSLSIVFGLWNEEKN